MGIKRKHLFVVNPFKSVPESWKTPKIILKKIN